MANSTLRKVITAFGVQGEAAIDQLTKESGILQTAEAIPANKNISHTYKRVDALPAFAFSAIGTGQADVTVNSNIYQSDLKVLRAIQSEQTDVVDSYPGGAAQFFRDDMPAFNEGYGQAASDNIIYGINSTFGDAAGIKGLWYYVNAYTNYIRCTGTSGSTTSIFAVKYRPGKNGCGILYNPQVANSQGLMKTIVMNNGQPILEVTNTTTGAKKPVYQVIYESYLGFLSTSSYDVAAITRIQDADSDRPTAVQMDEVIDKVRGNSSNTVLYMNRTAYRMVRMLKNSALQMVPTDLAYSSLIATWNGVPIVIDDNIVNTESTALDT
jgi:hypothetical protein